MFDGAHFHLSLHQNGAALGVAHQVSVAINDGLTLYIHSLNLITVTFFCRTEHSRDELARVKSLTFQRERRLQGLLFLHFLIF